MIIVTFKRASIVCIVIVGFQMTRSAMNFMYEHFVGPRWVEKPVIKDQGEWAVVTGATHGLGRAFIQAFASRGMNVVMIGKNEAKLKTIGEFIEQEYKVKSLAVEVDFQDPGESYKLVLRNIFMLDVGVLVNNVHEIYPIPENFLDLRTPEKTIASIIYNNVYSVTNMTKLVLASMLDKKRGIIINVSDIVAEIPCPMLAVYSASNAYIRKFSMDLAIECEGTGVIIQCLTPGFIDNSWLRTHEPCWLAPSPENYVENALNTLGVMEKTPGYYPHSLALGFINLLGFVHPLPARWFCRSFMNFLHQVTIRGHA